MKKNGIFVKMVVFGTAGIIITAVWAIAKKVVTVNKENKSWKDI